MRIRVVAFARLRELLEASQHTLELPNGARAGDAWEALVRECPALADHRASTRLAVGGRIASLDDASRRRRRTGAVAAGRRRLSAVYRIVADPIDPQGTRACCRSGEHGGVVTFLGVVRPRRTTAGRCAVSVRSATSPWRTAEFEAIAHEARDGSTTCASRSCIASATSPSVRFGRGARRGTASRAAFARALRDRRGQTPRPDLEEGTLRDGRRRVEETTERSHE